MRGPGQLFSTRKHYVEGKTEAQTPDCTTQEATRIGPSSAARPAVLDSRCDTELPRRFSPLRDVQLFIAFPGTLCSIYLIVLFVYHPSLSPLFPTSLLPLLCIPRSTVRWFLFLSLPRSLSFSLSSGFPRERRSLSFPLRTLWLAQIQSAVATHHHRLGDGRIAAQQEATFARARVF